MRKAATTCLVALIAAATAIYDIDEASVDARTDDEVHLDLWLSSHCEPIRRLLGPKVEKLRRDGEFKLHNRKRIFFFYMILRSVNSCP